MSHHSIVNPRRAPFSASNTQEDDQDTVEGKSEKYKNVNTRCVDTIDGESEDCDNRNSVRDLRMQGTPYANIDCSAAFGEDPETLSDKSPRTPSLRSHGGGYDNRLPRKKPRKAPEQKVTLFALRLAILEKTATWFGKVAFLWSTVVILGGFASSVSQTDFYVVTVILLTEGARLFSRSHELEWHLLTSKSWDNSLAGFMSHVGSRLRQRSSGAFRSRFTDQSFKKESLHPQKGCSTDTERGTSKCQEIYPKTHTGKTRTHMDRDEPQRRTWAANLVPIVPYTRKAISTELVGRILYLAQIVSALSSVGLSIWRLTSQNFSSDSSGDNQKNLMVSVNVVYSLAIAEASLFVLERAYWEYTFRVTRLLENVTHAADLGVDSERSVEQFFYDVYSKCLNGSIYDGLEMDLVSYSITRLQSESLSVQLDGARLLNKIVSLDGNKAREGDPFAVDALRRIGTTPGVIERFVEMLSWHSKREETLLKEVSDIVCRLVRYSRNCSRIVAVPGCMDGLVSLLLHGKNGWKLRNNDSGISYTALELQLNGLRILKYLSKNHKNCVKIGETRSLLSILVIFLEVRDATSFVVSEHDKGHFKIYKKSLQLLGLLAAATNTSGKILRPQIAGIASCLRNLRDILEHGNSQPELQRLATEIITSLALDDGIRTTMGSTGGIVRNLYELYENKLETSNITESSERKKTSTKAGEALSILAIQCPKNCSRMLSLKDNNGGTFVSSMLQMLYQDNDNASSAALILRSVFPSATSVDQREISTASRRVLDCIMDTKTNSRLYECFLGLLSKTLIPLSSADFISVTEGCSKLTLVKRLLRNLRHTPTTSRFPRIRRFTIEVMLVLVTKDAYFLDTFRAHNVEMKLEQTLDSISELENFCLFSGMVGLTRSKDDIEDAVQLAIKEFTSEP